MLERQATDVAGARSAGSPTGDLTPSRHLSAGRDDAGADRPTDERLPVSGKPRPLAAGNAGSSAETVATPIAQPTDRNRLSRHSDRRYGGHPMITGPVSPTAGRPLAAIYARVSSEKPEHEQTIASQLEALYQAVAARGYAVTAELVFVDEGYCGARLGRPGLERLRDVVAEGTVAAIRVYAPERLARHYAYQVVIIEELTRVGCEVIFLNHAFGESPEEQMLLQVQGVFAEYERALITERTRRGRLFAGKRSIKPILP